MDTAVATYDDSFAAFQAAADSMQGEGKPILKFNKGRWLLGQDDEILEPNTEIAVNVMEAETGWIFWRDGKPEERLFVRIASGRKPEMRSSLGHDDQALWETDKEGKPVDPWARVWEIPAREIDGDQREVTIAGGSKGFEKAAKKLFNQFGQEGKLNQGKVAVVQLGAGTYKHPTWGLTDEPYLTITRWIDPPVDLEDDDEPANEPEAEETSVESKAPKAAAKKQARF